MCVGSSPARFSPSCFATPIARRRSWRLGLSAGAFLVLAGEHGERTEPRAAGRGGEAAALALRFGDIGERPPLVERSLGPDGSLKRTKTGQIRSVRLLAP